MELRHLRYFVAVAEELNFRRAAERIHISQPSLSAQIRQLEERVGARLLERDTHQVALTPAGRAFLEGARRILRDAEDTARLARRVAHGEEGRLSIGFVASLGHGFLPNVLRVYRQSFPAVELRLEEMDTTRQIEALTARRLDLGFIGLGLPTEVSDLEIAKVAEERLVAVLPQEHGLAARFRRRGTTLPLAALAKERFLLAARESAPLFNPWLVVLCQQAGFHPHIVQETGQPISVLNYVAAGLGVTLLPEQYSRFSTAGVHCIPLEDAVPRYRYCAAWSPRNPNSSLLRFIAIAVQEGAVS